MQKSADAARKKAIHLEQTGDAVHAMNAYYDAEELYFKAGSHSLAAEMAKKAAAIKAELKASKAKGDTNNPLKKWAAKK